MEPRRYAAFLLCPKGAAVIYKYVWIVAFCVTIIILSFSIRILTTDKVHFDSATVSAKEAFELLDWTASLEDYHNYFSLPGKEIDCSNNVKLYFTTDRSRLEKADVIAFHLRHMPENVAGILKKHARSGGTKYSLVYNCESDVHTEYREEINNMNFIMSVSMDYSFPKPITYFTNITRYLKALLQPPIPFSNKWESPVVWMCSNCDAMNGRTYFVKMLMKYVQIDSYGSCLKNKESGIARIDFRQNFKLYRNYKFVLSIENSNCKDYVTEKLLLAYVGGAIPIVASYDNTPNYLKFAPNNSFINVYDFKSIEELAAYINKVSSNESLYNEYMKFRLSESDGIDIDRLDKKSLVALLKKRIGEQTMFKHLLRKETGEHSYCKVANYLHKHQNELPVRSWKRYPTREQMCLSNHHLSTYFNK